jgi:hypothetical protein
MTYGGKALVTARAAPSKRISRQPILANGGLRFVYIHIKKIYIAVNSGRHPELIDLDGLASREIDGMWEGKTARLRQ